MPFDPIALQVRESMSPLTVSIGRDQTLAFAAERMREHKIRHLPVLDGGKLIGVLSERDIDWLSSRPAVDPETMPVTEAMSDPPYAVPPDASIESVVREMERHKYGTAIIVEHGQPVGIFTTIDALRLCADLIARLKAQ